MSSNITKAPPPLRSRRVESWVYTILNPLIESLRRETGLLRKGNLSWRWYSRKCEYLRPIVEYVDDFHQPNLEDFLADNLNQGFKEDFESHDRALDKVESNASRFFDGLMQSGIFPEQVKSSLKEYESRGDAMLQYPSLDSMKQDLPKYVAEYLINRTDVLPHHYVAHQFWKEFRREFERSEDDFDGYQQRASFRALKESAASLEDLSGKLLRKLEEHRLFLCGTYDVPAAPTDSNMSSSSDAFLK